MSSWMCIKSLAVSHTTSDMSVYLSLSASIALAYLAFERCIDDRLRSSCSALARSVAVEPLGVPRLDAGFFLSLFVAIVILPKMNAITH